MEPNIPIYLSVLFTGLTAALSGLIIYGVSRAIKKMYPSNPTMQRITGFVALCLVMWLIFLKVISTKHILDQWSLMPPRLMIILLPPLIVTILIASSKKTGELLKNIPTHWMIYVQSFRILMEVILLLLFVEKIIPVQMTFEGRNFDILVGITALITGTGVMKNKISPKGIIAWNMFGLILLANIVIVAVLSTPLPIRTFMNEPANTVIAYFPFVWLAGFVVPVAYSLHVFSIKKALAEIKQKQISHSVI